MFFSYMDTTTTTITTTITTTTTTTCVYCKPNSTDSRLEQSFLTYPRREVMGPPYMETMSYLNLCTVPKKYI